jgi:hypothetical protein
MKQPCHTARRRGGNIGPLIGGDHSGFHQAAEDIAQDHIMGVEGFGSGLIMLLSPVTGQGSDRRAASLDFRLFGFDIGDEVDYFAQQPGVKL